MVNVFLLMMMMRFFLNLDKDNFSSRIYAKTHFLYEITGNNKAHRFFSCLDVCLFICCSNIVDVNVKLNKMKIEKITMAKCVENRQREKILCRFLCLMRLIYKRFNSSRKQTKWITYKRWLSNILLHFIIAAWHRRFFFLLEGWEKYRFFLSFFTGFTQKRSALCKASVFWSSKLSLSDFVNNKRIKNKLN